MKFVSIKPYSEKKLEQYAILIVLHFFLKNDF